MVKTFFFSISILTLNFNTAYFPICFHSEKQWIFCRFQSVQLQVYAGKYRLVQLAAPGFRFDGSFESDTTAVNLLKVCGGPTCLRARACLYFNYTFYK